MTLLTVDIPDHLYATTLRLVADLLDDHGHVAQEMPASTGGSTDTNVGEWAVETSVPDAWSHEIQRLAKVYANLTPAARSLVDELLRAPHGTQPGPIHQDQLIRVLNLDGTSGLAGTVGHITKTAAGLGRVSPVQRDASRKAYFIPAALREPLRQARLWSVGPIAGLDVEDWTHDDPVGEYVHEFSWSGGTYRYRALRPQRFLMVVIDEDPTRSIPAFYESRHEMEAADGECWDPAHCHVQEFVPDHERGVLVSDVPPGWVPAGLPSLPDEMLLEQIQ